MGRGNGSARAQNDRASSDFSLRCKKLIQWRLTVHLVGLASPSFCSQARKDVLIKNVNYVHFPVLPCAERNVMDAPLELHFRGF